MVSTRSSSAAMTPRAPSSKSDLFSISTPAPKTRSRAAAWSHTPTTLSLLWLAISLPLVAWDTGYIMLRPASMPGGSLHWPLWVPYALYGEVDHVYGFKQWNAHNGFTAAQGSLNIVESLMYIAYVGLWYSNSKPGKTGALSERKVAGRVGALALLLGYSAAVMTVSKTVLYAMNEFFSGFDNVGHNKLVDLIFLWILPNGAWLVFPTIMIYQTGGEILSALTAASGRAAKAE